MDSQNGNWIKINRKMLQHPISKDPKYAWCWIYLLLRANYTDTDILVGNDIIHLKRGQFLTSRKTISKDTGIEESKVERVLKCLENEHQLEQITKAKYRVITILKYDYYQSNEQVFEQQVNSKRTASEQQTNTDKNIKNIKKEKKEREDKSSPSQIMKLFLNSEEEQDKQIKRLSETYRISLQEADSELEKFINYWEETTKSGLKQRWELEPTWDLDKRLNNWIQRSIQFKANKFKK